VNARWHLVVFQGDKAKTVKAHADAGIGYLVVNEQGQGKGYAVQAAMRVPEGQQPPANSRLCSIQESMRFDRIRRERVGLPT
jgi:hypothetical protein